MGVETSARDQKIKMYITNAACMKYIYMYRYAFKNQETFESPDGILSIGRSA